MWNIKVKDAGLDVQRAFNIWKGALKYDDMKKLRIKRLLWRCYNNKMAKAFE